ncbi:hypothetical protein [Streptomyces collinus]|uniref:hypothetical protein n=1 Tax=Streptomyces collinus TaxID=42684 RepID=UPI003625DCED
MNAFCGTWSVPNIPQGRNQGDVGYVYLDNSGDLVTGYFPPTQPGVKAEDRTSGLDLVVVKDSQGDVVSQPVVWQDVRGMLHLYGVTGTQGSQTAGTLSVLHQSDWKSGTATLFDPVFPAWTTAQVAGAATGIGGFDLMNTADRLLAYDAAGTGNSDHLMAYKPALSSTDRPLASVLERRLDGSFRTVRQFTDPVVVGDHAVAVHRDDRGAGSEAGDNCVRFTSLEGDGTYNSWSLFWVRAVDVGTLLTGTPLASRRRTGADPLPPVAAARQLMARGAVIVTRRAVLAFGPRGVVRRTASGLRALTGRSSPPSWQSRGGRCCERRAPCAGGRRGRDRDDCRSRARRRGEPQVSRQTTQPSHAGWTTPSRRAAHSAPFHP